MTEALLSLAALALLQPNGSPALLPLNLPQAFADCPFELSAYFEQVPSPELQEDWQRYTYQQYWFGAGPWPSVYLRHSSGQLQSITITPDPQACEGLQALVSRYIGDAYKQGASPHFLNSLFFARWRREGLEFVFEDYSPGCELSIYSDS